VGAVGKDKYNTDIQVAEANQKGLHIEMVGNFDINKPTQKQIDSLKRLLSDIDKRA